MILVSCNILCACGKEHISENLSITDYISINTSGSDGNGTASAEVDKAGLDRALKNAIGNENAETGTFLESININIDPCENLSIGDTLKVTVEYNENIAEMMGIGFETSYQYEVTDLDAVESINPFEYLSITYEGASPCSMAKFNYEGAYLDSTCFKITKINNTEGNLLFLKTGDHFTVEVSLSKEELLQRGCSVTKNTQDFTFAAENADSYAKSISEIKSDVLENMKRDVEAKLKEQLGESFVSAKYEGSMLAILNDVNHYAEAVGYTDGFPESANELYLAYKIKVMKGKQKITWYTPIQIEEVINSGSSQSYKIVEQNYGAGDYSYVTLNGLKMNIGNYSDLYDISYSVELQ